MRWHHRLYVALRGWFGSSSLDRDLNEELRFHFDRQVDANIAAGMTPGEARRSAGITVGNPEPIREASRDERSGAWLRQFGRDLAYGTRLLRKSSGFSFAAIAIIAIGVGAVTAIFSVVYGVALKPLPFREPDRLVNIWTTSPKQGSAHFPVNGADHRDWLEANHVFEDIALLRNLTNLNLIGDGEPERLLGARIASNLFSVLGVSPALGRGFTDEEDDIGNDRVVLLSDTFWRRRYAADPAIVGRTITLNNAPHVVVGVMGPEFQYPGREFQVWTPLTINPGELARKVLGNNHQAVARLKPGVTVAQAQSEMDTIALRLAPGNAMTTLTGVAVVPMQADLLANVSAALYVILAAVLCLLLVAALNLSTLLSARAAARSRELAVRLALGATRVRVAMQAIAEIAPLLLIGGILGILIAVSAIAWFIPLAPASLPRVENIEINGPVLAAALGILVITGVIAALLPAIQAWHSDLTSATRDCARTTGDPRHARARSVLVMTQIALALPLLTGSVLLARTFATITAIDPGFNPDRALSVHLAIPRSKYGSDSQIAQVLTRFMERVSAVPGVVAVGAVNRLPLGGGVQMGFVEFDLGGRPQPDLAAVDWRTATPDYFKEMGIPLVEGRTFEHRDVASAHQVGIIDDRVARLVWPNESAIGKRFRIPVRLSSETMPWVEIVGVVRAVKHDGLEAESRPQFYWNYEQRAQDRMVLVARADRDLTALARSVVQAIHAVDPEQPVYDVRTLAEVVERSLGQRWMNMTLVGVFATVALLLCSIGVYGTIAFGVARQRREFGIRLALGATRSGIAAGVVTRGLMLAGLGIAAGVLFAIAVARSMSSLLYGVGVGDYVSYGSAALAILAAALLASYLPARGAARVEPAITLRAE